MATRLAWLTALSCLLACAAYAQSARPVRVAATYWPTRAGVSARVLVMLPPTTRAGVMLLAGGHGNLNLDSQGQIGWGVDDFVVRTRLNYPQAGFAVALPDIPIDRKPPMALGDYRRSDLQAQDLVALSGRLKRLADPTFIIAYDRAVTSVLTAAARAKLETGGLVLVSPILDGGADSAAVFDEGARTALQNWPVLMISHGGDDCSAEPVRRLKQIAAGLTPRDFQPVALTGGASDYRLQDPLAYYQDPCNKKAAHALAGLDGPVTGTILDWMNGKVPEKR